MSSTYYKLKVTDRKKFGTKESNQVRKNQEKKDVSHSQSRSMQAPYSPNRNQRFLERECIFFFAKRPRHLALFCLFNNNEPREGMRPPESGDGLHLQ
mgnify:CR=1 FL=1